MEQFIHLLAAFLHDHHHARIQCVVTSWQTRLLILQYSSFFIEVPLWSVNSIDIAIDGADSILPKDYLVIKGGGAALLQEKLVALIAQSFVIVAEAGKRVQNNPCVPIEVLPLALKAVEGELGKRALKVQLRVCSGGKVGPIVTDNGNFIVDAFFERVDAELALWLKGITGVIEHGIFQIPHTLITEAND